jgi:hypothetical protein
MTNEKVLLGNSIRAGSTGLIMPEEVIYSRTSLPTASVLAEKNVAKGSFLEKTRIKFFQPELTTPPKVLEKEK